MNLDIDILITFREPPENCGSCRFCIRKNIEDARCLIRGDYVSPLWEDRHVNCPISVWEIGVNVIDEYGNTFDREKFDENLRDAFIMENIEKLVNKCLDDEEEDL